MILDSDNHITLADEPAWPVFVDELAAFLAPDRVAAPRHLTSVYAKLGLTGRAARAAAVARLLASG